MSFASMRFVPLVVSGGVIGFIGSDLYRYSVHGPHAAILGWEALYESISADTKGTLTLNKHGFIQYNAERMKKIYIHFFGEITSETNYPSSSVEAQSVAEPAQDMLHLAYLRREDEGEIKIRKDVPKDIRSRFLKYARLKDNNDENSEKVLFFDDFVACLLLLPMLKNSKPNDQKNGKNSVTSLPSHVQNRLKNLFCFIDMDKNNVISYGEFVVLFTMLSTKKSTLDTAFFMFDEDGNRKINSREFGRLLNTLMVDPVVQITYDGPEGEAGMHKSSPVHAKSEKRHDISSLLSLTRKAARERKSTESENLSCSVSSSFIQEFVCNDVFEHQSPPPGSTHYGNSKERKQKEKLYNHLRKIAKDNRKENEVSFDLFYYKMNYLQWELRAIEFGIFDQENKGVITVNNFRDILSCDLEQNGDKSGRSLYSKIFNFGKVGTKEELHSEEAITNESVEPFRNELNTGSSSSVATSAATSKSSKGPEPKITWQFYQTVFDIIKESDRTLPALLLALHSEPPVLPDRLVGGAIPDSSRKEEHLNNNQLLKDTTAKGNTESEKKEAKQSLAKRQRPTALTWVQFQQVLNAMPNIPTLSKYEQALFFELFDADRSGTITPSEFGQLCELQRSFFAPYLPRFSEPKRNIAQQFFYCMQQLD